ncbi:MAG: hypothetical protein H5U40_19445, partial [Polyangiaceae bacterium]|nr:hypothetical protein [Polyangiaceae bacterium]
MRAWVAAAFLLASCGAPGPLPRAELVDPPRAAAPTLRLLRSDTFTDLVRSVRDRGEDSHPESRRPCLVNVREDGALELESDL